jgi:hypothetical protein
MPSVTYDGRSFMLDGRRIWLAAGELPLARCPRDSWADRVHALKVLGANTVVTSMVWLRHESRPGTIDFTGDNDIRHFVKICHEAGMWCVIRLGPYVGEGYDLGGLPSWLLNAQGVKIRSGVNAFLEACSRFMSAVADQVRDLQVTAPGAGGPILAVQNEAAWFCGHEALADQYLGEIVRYQREAGLNVPILNSNNLWQSVEGEIDAWVGSYNMLSTMRQLGTVRSDQPKIAMGFETGPAEMLGAEPAPFAGSADIQRRLAEVLAGGGQFNLSTAVGGTMFGFTAGRSADGPDQFYSSVVDRRAPISGGGMATASFQAIRRITTFASRFSRLFSNLDPAYQPVVLDAHAGSGAGLLNSSKAGRTQPGYAPGASVVHASGQSGGVVFVFADESAAASQTGGRAVNLLLPDGTPLPIEMGHQSVVWCLIDAPIAGRSVVDYTNICALGIVGRTLVCYGPSGTRAAISVNGSPLEVSVPSGKTPPITMEHEGLMVVICSEEQADTTYFVDDSVYIGVASVAADGRPVPLAGTKSCLRIGSDGAISTMSFDVPKLAGAPAPIALSKWGVSATSEHADGTSPRYATIGGPGDLAVLGAAYGYGWYRISLKSGAVRKAHVRAPESADRCHVYLDGESIGVLGVGLGAEDELVLPLKKAQHQIVVLAENMGRFTGGNHLGESKGLFGHLLECEEVKLAKPKVVSGPPLEPLAFRAPLWDMRQGDQTVPDRITWTIPHRRKVPVLLELRNVTGRGLLLVNDKATAFVDKAGPRSIMIDSEQMGKGSATVQLALMPDSVPAEAAEDPEAILEAAPTLRAYEVEQALSAKADWAFARWDIPSVGQFAPSKAAKGLGVPAWYRTTFEAPKTAHPATLDLDGLTKGQVYLNGKHLGRYLVGMPGGKLAGYSRKFDLPRAFLKADEENELVVFDEHGAVPGKCRIVFDAALPIRSDPAEAVKRPDPPKPPEPKKVEVPVKKGKGAKKAV